MKIAITGGAGSIGSHLARAYLNAGHDVLVLDNLLHGRQEAIDERARFYAIDVRDTKLRTILQQERPDIVSHHVLQRPNTIANEKTLADADIHVRGLLNVLEGCVNAGVNKVIFASNGNSLFGHLDAAQLPVTEESPPGPRQPDDISKVAGEWYVRYYTHQFALKHTILRYADVYGEPENVLAQHPLTYFITAILQQQRPIIRGSGEEIRDQIFIDDVVKANIATLKQGDNQTLHISSNYGCSLNDLCDMVMTQLKSDLDPVHISGTLTEEYAVIMDNSRAQRVLEWQPEVSLSNGIKRSIELWYTRKATGPLSATRTTSRVPETVRSHI